MAVGGYNIEQGYLSDVEVINPFLDTQNCQKPPDYPQRNEFLCGDRTMFCNGYEMGIPP